MSVVAFGIEKGFIEKVGEDDIYIIHPRSVINSYVLDNVIKELTNEGYAIRRESDGGNPLLVAEKKQVCLWMQAEQEIPDIGVTVEIIDKVGYQRKAVYFVTKYGERMFDCGELYVPYSDVIVWRYWRSA